MNDEIDFDAIVETFLKQFNDLLPNTSFNIQNKESLFYGKSPKLTDSEVFEFLSNAHDKTANGLDGTNELSIIAQSDETTAEGSRVIVITGNNKLGLNNAALIAMALDFTIGLAALANDNITIAELEKAMKPTLRKDK